ncbi:hypothetical protein M422DRAFT_242015 [Sphaerobolus stellatus SS14]|nr:hypothetical protein M422DRAFT_242015 [Sphaerobolus stellatus SS14]
MVHWLDRQEKIRYFDNFLAWHHKIQLQEDIEGDEQVDDANQVEELFQETAYHLPSYAPTVAIKPAYTCQKLTPLLRMFDIQEQLFINALKQYEGKLLYGVNATGKGWSIETVRLPEHYQLLEVWTIFWLNLPLVDEAHDRVEQRIIRA